MAFLSTKTPLAANGTVTLGPVVTERADYIAGSVFSDQSGTLFVEQSSDLVNWDISTSNSVVANTGEGFKEELLSPYVRLRYVNGATGQGSFRIYTRFTSAGDS